MRFSLVALGLVGSAAVASAGPPPEYSVALSSHGSSIDLKLTNLTGRTIKVPARVIADFYQYDWLSVTLRGQYTGTRTLHFMADRDESGVERVELAPKATHVETIDLVPWAIRNGDPLAPGDYEAIATWDTTHETGGGFRTTATTKLTIAAPIQSRCKSASATGLSLIGRQVGTTNVVEVGLHNASNATLCVYSEIRANELQSDWLSIAISDPNDAKAKPRSLAFDDDRERSARITVELPPGATAWSRWDLAAWAKRKRNGGAELAKGRTFATATYDSTSVTDAFHARITGWFAIELR